MNPIFSGYSNSFDTGVAAHFKDVNVAIVLNHIIFWLKHNKAHGTNQIQGKTWMYESIAKMAEQFDYLNERQVKYCLERLVKEKILVKGNFNKNPFDKRSWYSLSDEKPLDKIGNTNRQNCPMPEEPNSQGTLGEEPKLSDPEDEIVPSHIRDMKPEDKKREDIYIAFGSFVKFKEGHYEELCKTHGKEITDSIIEDINNHCVNNRPKGYPDYAAAFRTFFKRQKSQTKPASKKSFKDTLTAQFKSGEQYSGYFVNFDEWGANIQTQAGFVTFQAKYSDNGFLEQFENACRKANIKFKR